MWPTIVVVILCVAPALSQTLTLSQQMCDANRRQVNVQTAGANVLIGGLFDIREPGTDGAGCGLPSKELMQVYEAARWTIGQLNTNNYVSGINFGMEAYDTCTLEGNAMAAVHSFYPQSIGRDGTSNNGVSYCTKSNNVYKLGLLGPMQSSVSLDLGEMLPRIPASAISMRSSAPSLSNKNLYPTFMRTDQSVSIFARAVSKMFKQLQWEKIVIVYADDESGFGGYQEILRAAYEAGICVSGVISVPHDGTVAEYQAKLQNIAAYGASAAVFYGSPTDAMLTLQAIQQLQNQPGIRDIKWMFGQLELETDYSSYTAAQGAIVVQATTTAISAFRSYYTNLNVNNPPNENPWLQDWYMNKYQCRFSNVNYAPFNTLPICQTNTNPRTQDFRQSPYVEQTITALYAYAEAIKRLCSGNNNPCTTVLRNTNPLTFHNNYLSQLDFTFPNNFVIPELRGRRVAFDVNGDPVTSAYTFYNYNNNNGPYNFQQFATYMNGNLQLASMPVFTRQGSNNLPVPSQCSARGCTNCLQPPWGITLAYKPGDIVIAALVDAHEPGQQGMSCGEVIPDRLIDAVAARYGVDTTNALGGRRVSVGYLIVDVCPGLQNAQSFLTNLLGGYKLYTDATGNIITSNNIVAVLDMTLEDTAWKIAPMLASQGIPQIRVAPTSSMLLHDPRYPQVISAVPSQETVQLAIVQMLSALNLKYVQIVSEGKGSYYRAAENFRRLASRMDICVAMWSTFDMDSLDTVRRMREVQNAPVVVVSGSAMRLRSLLAAVKTITASPTAQRQLTFVSGSEQYGTSDNIAVDYADEIDGSLFVRLSESSNGQMNNWLSGLSLAQIAGDAFLAEWFEQKFQCSLTSSSRGQYDRVCSSSDSITTNTVYQGYAPYIVNVIDSVAAAVSSLLSANCGSTQTGICAQYRNLDNLGKRIVNIVRNSADNTAFKIMNGEGMSDLRYFNLNNRAYTDVGRFDTSNRRLSNLDRLRIFVANGARADGFSTQCSGRCSQCQYAYNYQEFAYVPGDELIGATFSISNPGPDGQRPYVCGDVRSTNGFQYSAAVMYALGRINSGLAPVKLNNVTLGALIMDHCNNERRAYGQVADIYSGLTELTWRQTMGGMSHFTSNDMLAWLTDNTASTLEAAEILQPLGVTIVSPSATSASLMDNPTFFRTIQGDSTTAMAIVKLCKTLGLTYIQVVYAANGYGREGLSTMVNTARQEGLCVINSFEVADAVNASVVADKVAVGTSKVVVLYLGTSLMTAFLREAAQLNISQQLTIISPEPYTSVVTATPNKIRLINLLSLQLENPEITAYTNFLNNIAENSKNPFFAEYYMKLFQCNLPGYYMYSRDCSNQVLTSNNAGFVLSNFALSTINAVYAVAGALQTTLVEFCGQNYVGECSAFKQSDTAYSRFVENLKTVQFRDPSNHEFKFLEREGNVVYDVLRFNGSSYEKIGTYGGAALLLDNPDQVVGSYSNVVSRCSRTCSECTFSGLKFSHTPGDIYLGGVFDVHAQGQGVFDCGIINTEHGFQLLEAFHFALQQVNNKQGVFADILNGVTLGGVGLDACQSSIRGGYLVSNINNGLTRLVRDGREISPDEIDVYVGSYSSDSSIYLARILTDLKIPQISYAATSNTLENQLVYPYFFRTVPADDKQVLGMLQYLDRNDLRYVQLLYTDDSFGQQGVAQFDRLIRQDNFSICVAQRVVFPESGVVSEESSDDVVIGLLQKPVANTVVIFADTRYINAFLRAVARSPRAVETFKYVGPTTWGDRHEVTEDIGAVADNAVTFVLDFQGGVGGFHDTYLTQRNPTNAVNNPWFEEWFQYVLNCYTSPSNIGRYEKPCDPNIDLRTRVIEDNGILHVMNAVYSAAFALDATLKQICGPNYAAVCEPYRSNKQRRTNIRDNLEMVNFTDPTNTQFRFLDREGNKGYRLFKLTSSPVDAEIVYARVPVGEFNSNDMQLTLNMDLVPKYEGSCARKDACVECPTIRNPGVRYAVGGDPDGDYTVVGLFDIHNRGAELYQCGSINLEGFQKFLSFFWTYSRSFANRKIRLLALDTCSSSMRAGQYLYSLLQDGTLCNIDDFDLDDLGMENIGGVVVSGEKNTMAASRVLEPLRVTYVSPDAVSPSMDDYQYLLRSVTPWSGFVRTLALFLQKNSWNYVNSIYINSGMGREMYTVFQELFKEKGICLSSGLGLAEDPTDIDIRTTLSQLSSESGANVVVLLSEPELSLRIVQRAQELGIADDFLWIFGVDDQQQLSNIPAGVTFQALVMEPKLEAQPDFRNYLANLDYDIYSINRNRASIPRVWWEDFYQTVHRCRIENATFPLQFGTQCPLNLRYNTSEDHSKMIHTTYLASFFSMQGLTNFYSRCRDGASLQECLTRLVASRTLIRNDILDVQLAGDDTTYRFNKPLHYIEPNYNIYRYNVRNGQFQPQPPQDYSSYKDGDFTPASSSVSFTSYCKRADGCGCKQSSAFTEPLVDVDYSSTRLRNYYKYDNNHEKLYEWPIWAIVVGVLTCLGLLVTIIIFLYLLIAYPVKSGTSILGYLTIVGIMGVYAINFAFFLHASDATCGARRFVMGVVYTIVFASLFVKAVDNWRFADLEYGNHQYRGLTNSCTLFLMALGIVLIQCIIPIEWLILVHPTARRWTSLDMHDYWWCDPADDYDVGLVLSFIFVMFLVLLTAVFAGLAWDSESNNRESRWILVAAIATAGCFLVWMIVTTNAGPIYRDPAVAIANFVNATLLLILIPIRKLHLLYQSKNEKPEIYAAGFDPYSNVYANQSYDPEGEDYTYEPTEKVEEGFIAD